MLTYTHSVHTCQPAVMLASCNQLLWPKLQSSPSTDQQQQETLIEKYMQLPNQVWDDIINQVKLKWTGISRSWKCVEIRPIPQASQNVDVLKDHEAVKQMGSILKVP